MDVTVPVDSSSLTCLLIHNAPELINATASLISEEWPRGLSARITSLESSCEAFPTNLILINKESTVLAHCRLSLVSGANDSVLIETVVVSKSLRGLGLGKRIMNEAEAYAKTKGYRTMYLSTHDKQDFYRYLGYEESEAVTSLGGNGSKLNSAQLSGLLAAFGGAQTSHANDGRIWMKKAMS